jgi:hypothetical protein
MSTVAVPLWVYILFQANGCTGFIALIAFIAHEMQARRYRHEAVMRILEKEKAAEPVRSPPGTSWTWM